MLKVYNPTSGGFIAEVISTLSEMIVEGQSSSFGPVRFISGYMTPKIVIVSLLAFSALRFCVHASLCIPKHYYCQRKLTPCYYAVGAMMAITAVAALILLPSP